VRGPPTPDMIGEMASGRGRGGADEAEAERKKTLAMIMRTPEGKMWKAERKRWVSMRLYIAYLVRWIL
jgi:hypothetical protein